MIYEWSASERYADYGGASEIDEEYLCWSHPILGRPLPSIDQWPGIRLKQNELGGGHGQGRSQVDIGDALASGDVHIISRRAAESLEDIWQRHASLYPVTLEDDPGTDYYMVVVETELDCLIRRQSTGPLQKYGPNPNLFASVEKWVFDEECVADNDVFTIPDSKMTTYVTERFKQRVIEAGLRGFCLKKEFWEEDPFVS